MISQKKNILKLIMFLGDGAITYPALFLALLARNKIFLLQFNSFFINFIGLYLFWIVIIFVLNLYDLHFLKKPKDFFFSLIIFSILAFSSGVAYFYFQPEPELTPKTILILNVIVFDALFIIWRYVFNVFLEAKVAKEKAVVVGFNEKLEEIMPQLNKIYQLMAFFRPSNGSNNMHANPSADNVISDMRSLKGIVAEKKITSVIFASNFYSNKDLVKEVFYSLPLTLNYIDFNDIYEFIAKKVPLGYLDEVWFLQKISKSEGALRITLKRAFDLFFSAIGLMFFILLFPLIAVSIKLDSPGTIFYIQKRVGKEGRVFLIRKFRTMKEDKNQDKEKWREINKDNITRVGKVLRRMHLDELPQAWSILIGDLSFVGPRPEWIELAKIFEKEIPFYRQRYLVKPGLFGWAQINYPASKSVDEAKEKFEYDLYYIKNRSLLLDLEIILKAVKLFIW